MLQHRTIKGPFGRQFHLHRNCDGRVPRSLRPLRFASEDSARALLRQLRVPDEYWQTLARDTGDMAPQHGHWRDYLQVICNNLMSGRLRIYEVPVPDRQLLAGHSTCLQDRQGNQYQFAAAAYALKRAAVFRRFHSQIEIQETLHDLAPNLEQLLGLITHLKLAPSPQSLTYIQLIGVLADALSDETIVLYVQTPFKRPGGSGGATGTSSNMPGNRAVPLAPPSAPKLPVANPQTPIVNLTPQTQTTTNTPQNLEECAVRLKDARARLDQQGYQPKYTDAQQLAKVQNNEVSQERFLVSFQTENTKPDAKLAFQRESGLAPVWATSFDQLENADTDPKLIADILGTPYDPSKNYVLHIVDRGENLDLFGQNTLVPTWDNMRQPVQKHLGGKHEPEVLAEVMTPEYQREYAEHIEVYRSKDLGEFDKDDQKDYAESLAKGDQEKFVARHNVRTEIGANSEFTGNGLTQSREPSTKYGVVETLTLENNPPAISKMKNVATIKLIPRGIS